jgi:hypothetical protein
LLGFIPSYNPQSNFMANTPNLTTAAGILAAFNDVASDAESSTNAEAVESLHDLVRLFIRKPDAEIVSCVTSNLPAVHDALVKMTSLYPSGSEERKAVAAKRLSLVDEFVKTGMLDKANDWLVTSYLWCSDGSEERKAVAAKRLSLVDELVKTGMLDKANTWLATSYETYPDGSEERKAVAAKGVSLVDEFVKAGMLDKANDWLVTSHEMYPSGSEERKAVAVRINQINQKPASTQMGAAPNVNVTALLAAAQLRRKLAHSQATWIRDEGRHLT